MDIRGRPVSSNIVDRTENQFRGMSQEEIDRQVLYRLTQLALADIPEEEFTAQVDNLMLQMNEEISRQFQELQPKAPIPASRPVSAPEPMPRHRRYKDN